MTAIYDCYTARLIYGFCSVTCPIAPKLDYLGYSQFPLNSRSQILMTEIWDLGNLMVLVWHTRTRRRTSQDIGVDFVIHLQTFASLVTVDLWSQSYAGPHVFRLT